MSLKSAGLEEPGSNEPLVFMRFRPAWAYIEGIREFGRFFCETTSEAASRLGLARATWVKSAAPSEQVD